jgi:hypothetical protein
MYGKASLNVFARTGKITSLEPQPRSDAGVLVLRQWKYWVLFTSYVRE